ncbi:p115 like vesicle tethering protein [Myxozyma melibiosi]|uniref:P115 like vesicle tethering protein n=1 Tax=Myxozyma melibiosi TaxID=54550 RepID=A0ABR1F0I1_9ASCO
MQDYLTGFLPQTQPKPSTTALETIAKLCDRLLNSTLLEDRRAAVLGLKGFCREYREAVVTGGLRGLIAELQRDRLDTETIKATLETVLLLFVRDKTDTTADVDYIALWLADEFTQREENISLLIDILENPDFYVRLYTLQLLAAILTNRPERTKQCVFAAPLGISRFVSTLDDHREAIQNEAVMLLIHLVDGHPDIQKLVAFENTFDKIFLIIEREGGVEGGVIVRDCLLLIANLLRFNPSNQNLFRETSCIPRLSELMITDKGAANWDQQKTKNMILVLEICRLFVVEDSLGTPANQQILFQAGVLMNVLRLAFGDSTNIQVRAMALVAAGDLIRGHDEIQEKFSNIDVPYINVSAPGEPSHVQVEPEAIPVTQALLNWALSCSSIYAFDLRVGATMCLEGYLSNNNNTRVAFLEDAIDAYFNDNRGPKNTKLLSGILDHETDARTDPYKTWFACVIMLHIFEGGQELKDLARSITIGDEEQGEEVVTAIQTISANLVAALQYNLDARIPIAYIMLLCVWLYEDYEAIDDFLSEGSSVQSLVADVSQSSSHNIMVEGMCTTLLAVLYGYCTTQSPIPRPTLHRLLVNRIGRDSFIMKLRLLRRNNFVRDFDSSEILSAGKDETGLPKVFFNRVFIDFFKDRYSRLEKVLDKDPNRDPISPEAIEAQNEQAVESMESMAKEIDELRAQLEGANASIAQTQESLAGSVSQSETLAHEKEALSSRLEESSTVVKKLQEQLAAAEKEVAGEKEKAKEIEKKLGVNVQSLGLETMRLQKEKSELQESFRKEKNRADNMDKELTRSKERALQAESSLRSLKESAAAEKTKLEARLKQVEEQRSYTHAMMENKDKELKQVATKTEQLQTLLNGFKTKAADLNGQVDALKKEVADKEKAVEEVKAASTSKDQKISELEKEVQSIKTERDSLKSQVTKLEAEVKSVNEKLSAASSDKGAKARKTEEKLKETQAKLDALQKQFKEEKQKSTNALSEIEAKKTEVTKLKKSLKESEEKVEDLLLVMADLEEKIANIGGDEEDEEEEEEEDGGEDGDEEEEEEEEASEEKVEEKTEAKKAAEPNGTTKTNGKASADEEDEDEEDEEDDEDDEEEDEDDVD